MKNSIHPSLVLVSILLMFLSASLFSLFGFKIGEGGESQLPIYIEPAGYAFIIWGFIYLGFLAYGIYQLLPSQRNNPRFQASSVPIVINAFFNGLWFWGVASQRLWITVVCMGIMLVTLIKISQCLEIARTQVTYQEIWFARIPFTLYFGWITVAIPVNITAWLADVGWEGGSLSPESWSVILLVAALGITSLVYVKRYANYIYMLVGVWAFIGISVANVDGSIVVQAVALGGAILGLMTILGFSYVHRNQSVWL